jgi:single-stranded DNA-binding protein
MFFQVQALGNVEREPELHITEGGTPVTNFPLAVNTKRCREDITIWLNCYVWGGLAETIERNVQQSGTGLDEPFLSCDFSRKAMGTA